MIPFLSVSELHDSMPISLLPIGSGLLDGKVVRKARAWRDATLCDTNRAIHLVGAVLEKAMEMDAGTLISELLYISMIDKASSMQCNMTYLVAHISDNSVAFCEVEQRKWPLTVDTHDGTLSHSIRVGSNPSDIPIKCDGCRARHSGEGSKARQEALR